MGRFLLVALLLSGCANVGSIVPTLRYCDQVVYTRTGADVELHAKCRVPVGG